MSIGDRVASLSRSELVGLVVVVAVTLGGAGLWYTRSLPRPVAVQAAPAPAAAAAGASGAVGVSPTPSPAPVFVDVAGWVRHPGVYEFATGQRVIDAVDAAGGARPGADLTSLNLAAPLTDGTQILVSKENVVSAGGGTTLPGATTGTGGTLVNVNTASATELETLSGVGEVIAAAIVDYRTQNGPFTSVDQLEDVSGIGPATMEEIRDSVTV
ncbi:MAG: ComEA family DNA-binding protein [Actinomycetota bacterium]